MVGSSELDKINGLNSDLTIIENNEIKICETEPNVNEKCKGESICYNGEQSEKFKEIFCPVHGKRIIKMNNSNN